jgi:hypothetical protein
MFRISIHAQLGRVVWSRHLEAGQRVVDVLLDSNEFRTGVYFVSAMSGGEKFSERLVIAK